MQSRGRLVSEAFKVVCPVDAVSWVVRALFGNFASTHIPLFIPFSFLPVYRLFCLGAPSAPPPDLTSLPPLQLSSQLPT